MEIQETARLWESERCPKEGGLVYFHRWQATPRILDVETVQTGPQVPWSHPFVERLIATIRREYLDRLFFWTADDLERKLE